MCKKALKSKSELTQSWKDLLLYHTIQYKTPILSTAPPLHFIHSCKFQGFCLFKFSISSNQSTWEYPFLFVLP